MSLGSIFKKYATIGTVLASPFLLQACTTTEGQILGAATGALIADQAGGNNTQVLAGAAIGAVVGGATVRTSNGGQSCPWQTVERTTYEKIRVCNGPN